MNTTLDLDHIDQLRTALIDARAWTLAIYVHLTPLQLQVPYLRTVNPPLWEIGHVGWFQEYWCLRQRQHAPPLPSRLEFADRLYDSRHVPHATRWNLPLPQERDLYRYLEAVLEDTLAALEKSSPQDRYYFKLALFHEDMHTEAMLMTLQTLGYPAPGIMALRLPPVATAIAEDEVRLAADTFQLGSRADRNFVFDNEKWAHPVWLPDFTMDASAVTNRSFADFVDAGGYQLRELWSDAGWQWREQQQAEHPRYWHRDEGDWLVRRFDQWQTLPDDEPVMHVNCHEAEAWCRWAGRRLPSEAEWEFAARAGQPDGFDRYPWGHLPLSAGQASLDNAYSGPVPARALAGTDTPTGLRQLIGNVWEWTASPFTPYPGFAPDAYQEYSEPWFHNHQVIRGGSFCTRSRLVHSRFRNFYTPERNDMFVGFRSCAPA